MATCQKCNAPIVWRRTPAGKSNPLDTQPVPNGNIMLDGAKGCRVLGGDELKAARERGDRLFASHFATCPYAAEFRKRSTNPPG